MAISHFLPQQGWFDGLTEQGVNIYQCEFSIPDYQNELFALFGVPWSIKLERAVDKRKSEFLAGRFCAKKALANFGIENFTIEADKNRCPLWPQGVKGAITHSNSKAMVAVTQRTDILGIGIDIENIMSEKTMNNVKEAIVKGSEFDYLARGDMSATEATSLIFSIKESFFKAAYPSTGYYFDFDAVTLTEIDLVAQTFTLKVNQDLNPQVRPGAVYSGQFAFLADQVVSLLVI